jgi:hypothetical protein
LCQLAESVLHFSKFLLFFGQFHCLLVGPAHLVANRGFDCGCLGSIFKRWLGGFKFGFAFGFEGGDCLIRGGCDSALKLNLFIDGVGLRLDILSFSVVGFPFFSHFHGFDFLS